MQSQTVRTNPCMVFVNMQLHMRTRTRMLILTCLDARKISCPTRTRLHACRRACTQTCMHMHAHAKVLVPKRCKTPLSKNHSARTHTLPICIVGPWGFDYAGSTLTGLGMRWGWLFAKASMRKAIGWWFTGNVRSSDPKVWPHGQAGVPVVGRAPRQEYNWLWSQPAWGVQPQNIHWSFSLS